MASQLKDPKLIEFLEGIKEDKDLWKYFLLCMDTPRGSDHRDIIIPRLMEVIKEIGIEDVTVDEVGNIVARLPATPGLENRPGICLQGHSDMVCEKNEGVEFDFKKDAIQPRYVGDWLMASGTSLGADNGIAIAAVLAILADKELKHGPIEILITSDEEIGLIGASHLEKDGLKSKYLINCDSEEEYKICIGCAGGFQSDWDLPIERVAAEGYAYIKVAMKGMLGGHSGVQIHEGRANALKVGARVLNAASFKYPKMVLNDWIGGTAHNAIPREFIFEVCVPEAEKEGLIALLKEEYEKIVKEHEKLENRGMCLVFLDIEKSDFPPLDRASTMKLINFMNVLPFGPMRMSPDVEGLVETSFAGTVTKMHEKVCHVMGSGRSSRGSQLEMVYSVLCSVGGDVPCVKTAEYPGWLPILDSPLLEVAKKAHMDLFDKEPEVYAIHAGLECGLIQDKNPALQCISIGPEICSPHSPDEKIYVPSISRFFKFLRAIIEKLEL
jgi:dipeptidase D